MELWGGIMELRVELWHRLHSSAHTLCIAVPLVWQAGRRTLPVHLAPTLASRLHTFQLLLLGGNGY